MNKLNIGFYYLVLLLIVLFPFSRAAVSILVALISIISIVEVLKKTGLTASIKIEFLIVFTLFLSLCVSLFYTANIQIGINIIILKLPLLLSVFWIPMIKKLKHSQIKNMVLAYCSIISIVSVASIVNYFLHYDELNALILQSKPIPIKLSYIYHIEFSVASALSALFSMYFLFKCNKVADKVLFSVLTIIAIISLHILSARTGLLFLYTALGILGLYALAKYNFKYKRMAVLLAISLPLMAVFTVPTIKNRVANTIEDIQVINKGKDPNNYSMGQRVEAWKTSIFILKKNVLFGIGVGDVREEMDGAYVDLKSPLWLENRKKPHNQILETGLQVGLIGVVLLLIFMFYPVSKFGFNNIAIIAFTAAFFMAMIFESLLERQSGVIIFIIGFVLLRNDIFNEKGLSHKNE